MKMKLGTEVSIALALGIGAGIALAPYLAPYLAAFIAKQPASSVECAHILGSKGAEDYANYYLGTLREPLQIVALLVLLAGCLVLSILALLYLNPSVLTTKRVVDKGILGDARLISSEREIAKRNDLWSGRGEPKGSGLVLGSGKNGVWYDSKGVLHSIVVGRSGAGKTGYIALGSLALMVASGSNIIASGKNELVELTGDKAKELGYKIVVIDLNGYPGASRYNPLDMVTDAYEAGNTGEAVKAARQIAEDLVEHNATNPYFSDAARDLITALCLAVCLSECPREEKNMASVLRLLTEGTSGNDPRDPGNPLKKFFKALPTGHPALAAAGNVLSDCGATPAGKNVISNALSAISFFGDSAIVDITCASDVRMRDIIHEKTIVFLHLCEEGSVYGRVFTCFLNQWWREAQRVASQNAGQLPRRTDFLLDEFGNIPKTQMPEIITLSRSMGIKVNLMVQDLGQLNKYNAPGDMGAGRQKLLGSIGCKVALALGTPEDCEFFTKAAGKRTVRTRTDSSQSQGFANTPSSGTAFAESSDDLIHEWEWPLRAASSDGAIVVKTAENSAPERAGVFKMGLEHASNTPVAAFFGLGDPEHNRKKRVAYYAKAKESASLKPGARTWDSGVSGKRKPAKQRDEWDEWD